MQEIKDRFWLASGAVAVTHILALLTLLQPAWGSVTFPLALLGALGCIAVVKGTGAWRHPRMASVTAIFVVALLFGVVFVSWGAGDAVLAVSCVLLAVGCALALEPLRASWDVKRSLDALRTAPTAQEEASSGLQDGDRSFVPFDPQRVAFRDPMGGEYRYLRTPLDERYLVEPGEAVRRGCLPPEEFEVRQAIMDVVFELRSVGYGDVLWTRFVRPTRTSIRARDAMAALEKLSRNSPEHRAAFVRIASSRLATPYLKNILWLVLFDPDRVSTGGEPADRGPE